MTRRTSAPPRCYSPLERPRREAVTSALRANGSCLRGQTEVPALDCHEEGPPVGGTLGGVYQPSSKEGPLHMLHAGLDLSRKKLDVCLLSDGGVHLGQLAVAPDVDSLRRLARRVGEG